MHLRLPTSFCSPNFAYLMASDAKDALRGAGLDADAWWSSSTTTTTPTIINAGLAADAGYRGTFGHEAEESLDELRQTFRRKAHTAAMERCLTGAAAGRAGRSTEASLGDVTPGRPARRTDTRTALLRRRAAPRAARGAGRRRDGRPRRAAATRPTQVPMALRRARSTRISIDGNAHFCRGLLRTRYGTEASEADRPGRAVAEHSSPCRPSPSAH